MPHPLFTPWETATNLPQASRSGLLPAAMATPLSLLAAFIITVVLWPQLGAAAVAVGLVFGRMLALDLTTYTLPNVYTVPLLLMGAVHAFRHGHAQSTLLALVGIALLAWALQRGGNLLGKSTGMGGGDLKLLAALFGFLPLENAFFAIALGCLVWMPVAFAKPKLTIPFGVPLIIGWTLLLRFPHLPEGLPNALFLPIS